jgi:hypothetical protein
MKIGVNLNALVDNDGVCSMNLHKLQKKQAKQVNSV